ncbi:hypothetical protein H072_4999 [Dactylellina haptotyla CBS 200.50]|uniref:Uncharacterized protein n=1 Tax=Dactylellina haptotyla (strain CBS 200.50) TaxID=1284197 RepID=S8BNP8_DACHA|nr:hypothetical protein H072_4999 [Dactylellina haptotyla CBS 200.50]
MIRKARLREVQALPLILVIISSILAETTAAWWERSFPGWEKDSGQNIVPDGPINTRYACRDTGAKKYSISPEAVTIYNPPGGLKVKAVAYYRESNCKDTKGKAPDFLVILNEYSSEGINIVDMKFEEFSSIGAPQSFREVDTMHYAKDIYAKTGSMPKLNSIYQWDSQGTLKGWVHAPAAIQNFKLEDVATAQELASIQADPIEIPKVLGEITDRVLSLDPSRGTRLLAYLGIGTKVQKDNRRKDVAKLKKKQKAVKQLDETGQVPDPVMESLTSEQKEEIIGPVEPPTTANKAVPSLRVEISVTRRAGVENLVETNNPNISPLADPLRKIYIARSNKLPLKPELPNESPVHVPTPHEIANRPINYEMMTAQCLLSDNPLLWCQRYLAAYQYHQRLARAAYNIVQTYRMLGPENPLNPANIVEHREIFSTIENAADLSVADMEQGGYGIDDSVLDHNLNTLFTFQIDPSKPGTAEFRDEQAYEELEQMQDGSQPSAEEQFAPWVNFMEPKSQRERQYLSRGSIMDNFAIDPYAPDAIRQEWNGYRDSEWARDPDDTDSGQNVWNGAPFEAQRSTPTVQPSIHNIENQVDEFEFDDFLQATVKKTKTD